MYKVIAIIPARYGSTRFPGKPLVEIEGKTMIQRVYDQVKKALDDVWVATDDERILNHVKSFGNCIMTSGTNRSGTERCAEAAVKLSEDIDFMHVVNVQGDEPFIFPEQITELISELSEKTEIATQKRPITDRSEVNNPNVVKVVQSSDNKALYFSRSPIPYYRDEGQQIYYAHVGMYAYRADILSAISELPEGKLEIAENLEQLRWLEAGYKIEVFETIYESKGIDSPEDINRKTQ